MENNTIGAIRGVGKAETLVQRMPMIGSVMRTKWLSDITNVVSAVKTPEPGAGDQENGVKAVPLPTSAKDYVAQLLKENTALLRLLGERNKMIEVSGTELQNLRTALQKAQQQNWNLAQANSRMLAELNLGKDRQKAMQHELGCALALHHAKSLELEVEKKKKVDKHLPQKPATEPREEGGTKCAEVVADAANPSSFKMTCNTNRKRALRSQSLGSSAVMHESAAAKDENRRRSLRRRSATKARTEIPEPSENLFEIEDVRIPIRSVSETLHENECSPPNMVDGTAHTNVKNEADNDGSSLQQNQNGSSRRSSFGRPMRRAAEKVVSYKEKPLNAKMRRAD